MHIEEIILLLTIVTAQISKPKRGPEQTSAQPYQSLASLSILLKSSGSIFASSSFRIASKYAADSFHVSLEARQYVLARSMLL